MARGRLEPPNLDDRTWEDIKNQAIALIPTYAPEWTDHNPSDLGITLIELFAWMVEGLIYRLNRVPEKNYVAFLNLMGIVRKPAVPASTVLSFAPTGSDATHIRKGDQFSTKQTETEEAVVFEVDDDLFLLPTEAVTFLLISGDSPNALTYTNITPSIIDTSSTGRSFGLESNKGMTVAIGINSTYAEKVRLRVQFKGKLPESIQIRWSYSDAIEKAWPLNPDIGTHIASRNIRTSDIVVLSMPETWVKENPSDWNVKPVSASNELNTPLRWIGIEFYNNSGNSESFTLQSIDFINAISVTNALTIPAPEMLGVSNGESFQHFELAHRPLYKRPNVQSPYDHLLIEVRELEDGEFHTWQPWTQLEDFPQGPGQVYRLDPVIGTINFGNYHPTRTPDGHGSIPLEGSEIRATSYRYVAGGANGNVPPGTITEIRKVQSGVNNFTLAHLSPAIGGVDEEAVEDALQRGPTHLRSRNLAVSKEDYETLAMEASAKVKKVRCLPPQHFSAKLTGQDTLPDGVEDIDSVTQGDPMNYGGFNRGQGHVNLIIISDSGQNRLRPIPTAALLNEVRDYLEGRKMLTTVIDVKPPRYVPIKVTATVKVWPTEEAKALIVSNAVYQAELNERVKQFLHPLHGGKNGKGWGIGQDIFSADILEILQPPSTIGFIESLHLEITQELAHGEPPFQRNASSTYWVQIADYEILCSADEQGIQIDSVSQNQ